MNTEPNTIIHYGRIGRTGAHYRIHGRWLDHNSKTGRLSQPPHLDVLVIDGQAWETSLGTIDLYEPALFVTDTGRLLVRGLATFVPNEGELLRIGVS